MKYDVDWLRYEYDRGTSPSFLFFYEPTRNPDPDGRMVLSQWYPSAFSVSGEGYIHAAHWMMVQKARLFGDQPAVSALLASTNDSDIRDRGRHINGFDQQRWDEHKYSIVLQGNLHKFSQHNALQAYISTTYPLVLTEANPDDRIWGIGMAEDSPGAKNPHLWKGLNLLGFALMEVRDLLSDFAGAISAAVV